MHETLEQHIQALLYGDSTATKQAKKILESEFSKMSRTSALSKKVQEKKSDKEGMYSIIESVLSVYPEIGIHNKMAVLKLMSTVLVFHTTTRAHSETLLACVREALRDEKHGNLRQVAVTTASDTYMCSTSDSAILSNKKLSEARKNEIHESEILIQKHITSIFDYLETIIAIDEDTFPCSIEQMKPSVVKSHLLYLFAFDRMDTLFDLSGHHEPEPFQVTNQYYVKWRNVYQTLFDAHPHIKTFITRTPRYREFDFDDEDKDVNDGDALLMAFQALNRSDIEGVRSVDFFSGMYARDTSEPGAYFSIPKDGYFELMDIIDEISDPRILRAIADLMYEHAKRAPSSEMYWYDVLDFACSRYGDMARRVAILEEALEKMRPHVDVELPIQKNSINEIHYGVHKHRPIFRILLSYAMYHHEHGDRDRAKKYYTFLLALNPNDNLGVRYYFAALYAYKPIAYVDALFETGNQTHMWDSLELFLKEQNDKHHFYTEPTE